MREIRAIGASATPTSSDARALIGQNAERGGPLLDADLGRIASPGMLLNKFPPMTGAASPNRVGVVDGGKDQHGRAARGGVGGGGALPAGQAGGGAPRSIRDAPADKWPVVAPCFGRTAQQ